MLTLATEHHSWCRTNAYLSFWEELVHHYASTAAALIDTYVANPT